VTAIMPLDPLGAKLDSFGWNVAPQVVPGHDPDEIAKSFAWLDQPGPWPRAVVYATVKGRGVSFTEGRSEWHGAPIDDASWKKGRPELVAELEKRRKAAWR
jgi:transketolase